VWGKVQIFVGNDGSELSKLRRERHFLICSKWRDNFWCRRRGVKFKFLLFIMVDNQIEIREAYVQNGGIIFGAGGVG
jgi:hypothetical protein